MVCIWFYHMDLARRPILLHSKYALSDMGVSAFRIGFEMLEICMLRRFKTY